MQMKMLACVLAVGGAFVAMGCGGDDPPVTPDPDAGTADSGPEPLPPLCESPPCDRHTYVINELDIGREDPMGKVGIVPGFNLDGVVSTEDDPMGCYHEDTTSPPPDNEQGVDNVLGGIVGGLPGDISGTIQENLSNGSLILLVEVDGVDDFTNDRNVHINMLLGQLPPGCDPMAMPACPMLDMMGRVAAGQTFDVIDQSYLDGMMGMMARISVDGSITNGRLRAGPVDIPLALPIMGVVLELNIMRAQLRFNITETALSNGIIGGALDTDQVVAAVASIESLADYVDIVMRLLEMNADLDPDPAMMGECQSVSLGLTFGATTGVKGNIVMMPIPPPPPDAGPPPADAGMMPDAGPPA